MLSQNQFSLIFPTVRSQQFSDSFTGFTFIVEKKFDNEIKNIFLHDTGNNLKNLSSNTKKNYDNIIIAEKIISNGGKKDVFFQWTNYFLK